MTEIFPFEEPLVAGTLVQRYKRFLADIELDDGTKVTAHCPNSGSMLGMKEPGSPVYLRHVPDPKRKLKWTWELISPDDGKTWVGCNTMRPNAVVEWAIRTGQIPGLDATGGLRREVKYGNNSRIDILLGPENTGTYVEVKNTTLAQGRTALFPDAVTARGAKHMRELQAVVAGGGRGVVVFFVNRDDCHRFAPAIDIDPTYAGALAEAEAAGVEVIPLGMSVSPAGWRVRRVLPR